MHADGQSFWKAVNDGATGARNTRIVHAQPSMVGSARMKEPVQSWTVDSQKKMTLSHGERTIVIGDFTVE